VPKELLAETDDSVTLTHTDIERGLRDYRARMQSREQNGNTG
jgi:hypothetical protein